MSRSLLKPFLFVAGVQRACLQLSRGQQALVGHPSRRKGLPGPDSDSQVRASSDYYNNIQAQV